MEYHIINGQNLKDTHYDIMGLRALKECYIYIFQYPRCQKNNPKDVNIDILLRLDIHMSILVKFLNLRSSKIDS